jgi:hypothetical protein
MAKIIELRSRQPRKSRQPEVSLVVETDLCKDVDLRNLIDDWIVPKMVDEWISQTGAKPLDEHGDDEPKCSKPG